MCLRRHISKGSLASMSNDTTTGASSALAGMAQARGDVGPGVLLGYVMTRAARTRGELARVCGLARSTIGQRLEPLLAAGLLQESEAVVGSRGRPSRILELNPRAGLIVAIDIGEERTRIALSDLEAHIIAEKVETLQLSEGPEPLLDRITAVAHEMILEAAIRHIPVAGIGLGLPAPVDYDAGRVMGWSIMAGWDGYDIRRHLSRIWPVPILIDNDVNLLTLAEQRFYWPNERYLFYVKAGTGVGSGMIIDGKVNRGAQGAAGDIGHAHIAGYGDPQCRCGNSGCLESLVGGWALARDLRRSADLEGHDARDVVAMIRRDDSAAVTALRSAGRILGEAVAYATSLLNPDVIVIGGRLAMTGDHLLAGVREVVYQRSLPLATRQLQIVTTHFKSRAGIAGAAHLVRDHVLAPAAIDTALARGAAPIGWDAGR